MGCIYFGMYADGLGYLNIYINDIMIDYILYIHIHNIFIINPKNTKKTHSKMQT